MIYRILSLLFLFSETLCFSSEEQKNTLSDNIESYTTSVEVFFKSDDEKTKSYYLERSISAAKILLGIVDEIIIESEKELSTLITKLEKKSKSASKFLKAVSSIYEYISKHPESVESIIKMNIYEILPLSKDILLMLKVLKHFRENNKDAEKSLQYTEEIISKTFNENEESVYLASSITSCYMSNNLKDIASLFNNQENFSPKKRIFVKF